MTLLKTLLISLLFPISALAQDSTAPTVGPVNAADVTIEQFLWERRPIVIFADTPNDPLFRRQMDWIAADLAALDERDVVVIVDTAPEERSSVRQRLRPRGFSLVVMDKDGEVKNRKPQPQTVREISRTIDRFPLRRQEMLERRPSGR